MLISMEVQVRYEIYHTCPGMILMRSFELVNTMMISISKQHEIRVTSMRCSTIWSHEMVKYHRFRDLYSRAWAAFHLRVITSSQRLLIFRHETKHHLDRLSARVLSGVRITSPQVRSNKCRSWPVDKSSVVQIRCQEA